MTELEDLYRPYRPKRRTRATIAKEKGLEPLAEMILSQEISEEISKAALDFVCEQNGVNSAEEAIEGAKDIIAEIISDNAENRRFIRSVTFEKGIMASKAAKENEESVYEMYYDFSESVKKIAGHRVLAINRGEEEGFLRISPVGGWWAHVLPSQKMSVMTYDGKVYMGIVGSIPPHGMTPEVRKQTKDRIIKIATMTAESFGATVTFEWNDNTAALINDPESTKEVENVATRIFGKDHVITSRDVSLAGDDFAEYISCKKKIMR